MKRIDSGTMESVQFEGLSHPVTGWRWPPKGRTVEEMRVHPLNHSAQHAIAAVGVLDGHVAAAKSTKEFSDEGIAKIVAPSGKAAQEKVSEALSTAEQTRKRNAAARDKLFALPQLDPGDFVGAHVDREIRDRMAALPVGDLAKHVSDPRVLHALVRDPLPSTAREYAKATWNAHVEKDNRDAIDKLNGDDDMANWLHSIGSTLHNVLTKALTPTVTQQRAATTTDTHVNSNVSAQTQAA